jgi:UDP-glucose 4-epimerase
MDCSSRALSYIADVAPVIASSPLHGSCYNQVFNIGADSPCTVLELAQELARAFNVQPVINHLPARNEVVHAYASHDKLRRFFPNLPAPTSLRDGVARMSAWVRSVGPQQPTEFSDIEILEKLPPSWRKNK